MLAKLYKNTLQFFVLIFLLIAWIFYNFQVDEVIISAEEQNLSSFTQDTIEANQLILDAEELYNQSQYKAAIEKYEVAKEVFKRYELWEEVVKCAAREALIADNFDISTKSTFAYESLTIARKYLNPDHFQFGKAYQQVAEVEMMNEDYDSSIIYFNRALQVFEKHEEWTSYAWAIISKSVNYFYKNDLELFKKELLVAQEYFEKYDLDREIYITTIDLLAVIYDEQGDFEKAIENAKNSIHYYLDLPNKSQGDSNSIAINYGNIGIFYSDLGDYQKANDFTLKAIEFSTNVNSSHYLNLLIQICNDALNVENYEKSISYGHRALSIIPKTEKNKQKDFYPLIYDCIGASFMALNLLDSSEYYLKLGLEFPSERYLNFVIIDYVELLLRQQKTEEALKVLSSVNQSNLTSPSVKGLLLRNIGRAYCQKNDFEKGLFFFQKLLHHRIPSFTDTLPPYNQNPIVFGKVKEPLHLLEDLKYKAYHLSQFTEKKQNLEAALATYDLAFQWMDTLLQKYAYEEIRVIHNQRNREIYEQAIDLAQQLYEQTGEKKYIHKAFAYTEKIKSNILLMDLQSSKDQTIIPERIQERRIDLTANIAFYERQLEDAKKDSTIAKIKLYQNYLTNYRIALGELKDSIKANYSKYYELKYSTILSTLPTIQANLKSNEAFLSYYSGDSSTYVFSISDNNIAFEKLEKTTIIDEQIINLRNLLNAPQNKNISDDFRNYNQVSNLMYQMILRKSINNFNSNINKLIIIPDGTLNYIPFEILTDRIKTNRSQDFSEMPYLLYKYQIQYGYSATLLRENKERQNQIDGNSQCLAYAPIYKNDDFVRKRGRMDNLRNGITALQNTSKEVDEIANYFEGDFNQSETATKANFIKAAPNYGILHLAMHGEANYENEKFANLKFSNTKNQSENDYLLYQGEIANLDLNAQLVVLSACETGVGKYLHGEGIASLGRSFMYAGVPSIVMSLWKVDDGATSQLMPYFYEKLAAGLSKDAALHQAKLTFLEKEDLSKLHPHYWASFVSIGDVQPIKNRKDGKYLIIGGLLLLIIGGAVFIRYQRVGKMKK